MGELVFIVCRGRHTVNSRWARVSMLLWVLRCTFPAPGLPQTRYDSHRAELVWELNAGPAAKEGTVLCRGEPGGAGPALPMGRVFSRRGRRLPALCQHRRELAAARHLRRN